MSTDQPGVILASTSRYRRALLARLLPDFRCQAPDFEEVAGPGEAPLDLARRLAEGKAASVAGGPAIVIGSDQVAALGTRVLGKPGGREAAQAQLADMAGQAVVFHTAVCVIGPGGSPRETHVDTTTVRMRALSAEEISRYLDRDEPYDCAGSFKAESMGVTLMESMENQDPTAIQGLPLIWLASCLRRLGLRLP